ncbi:MAG: hypothetical protein Q4C47_09270 [Planctomycetia bacterium]|nr:hypothetical protein [Planctomycetia bacterium]
MVVILSGIVETGEREERRLRRQDIFLRNRVLRTRRRHIRIRGDEEYVQRRGGKVLPLVENLP